MKANKSLRALAAIFIISAAVLAIGASKTHAQLAQSTSVLGQITNPSRPGLNRDGGMSIKLGNKILWAFGDTIFSPASVDGTHLRTNTAALADISNPYVLSEPLDANGAPYQFIPFSTVQQNYNNNATDKAHDRYIIWPDRLINIDADNAYIFYKNIKSTPTTGNSYTLTNLGIGVARVGANSTTATRVQDVLFSGSEDNYVPEVIHGNYVYAFHCVNGFLVGDCAVARTTKANILNRSSYQFWDSDNSTWQSDITQATHNIVGSTNSMSIIYSQYLKKYLMLGAGAFSSKLYLRTADNIEGPWTDRELFYDNTTNVYGGRLHQELSSSDGRTIPITYSASTGIKIISLSFDPNSKGAGAFALSTADTYLNPVPVNAPSNNNQNGDNTPSPNPNTNQNPNKSPLSPKTGVLLGSVIIVSSLSMFAIAAIKEAREHKRVSARSDK